MKCKIKNINTALLIVAINVFLPFSSINASHNSIKKQKSNSQYISETLNKNDIIYKVIMVKSVQPTDLVIFNIDQYAISPFLYLSYEKDGASTINMNIPQQRIAVLFEKAAKELENDNYEEVKNLYQQAYNLDSLYFKAASNLGDAWSFLGDYKRAEFYLKKAIRLNSAGYQEYLFLADAYDKMGKNKDALNAITYAFMLNKNNPYLLQCLKKILKKNNLSLKIDRLEFPFRIRKTGVRECEILYDCSNGYNWQVMANCLACWTMEPDLQIQLNGEEMFTYKVNMYKECLLNQGLYLSKLKNSGKKLSVKEELFLKKINDNFVNSMVYWEIIAGEEPHIMFLLSGDERLQIVRYIRKYVYTVY